MLLYLGSHVRGNSRACSAIKSPLRLKRFGLRNAVSVSSARTTKRFPSSRCASAIQIVRPLESIAETQPQLQPAFLRLSVMISQYRFTHSIVP